MQRIYRLKMRLALLLLPALAFGPIGCGPEAIPMVMMTCGAVGTVAFTIHEIQCIELARLDIEMKQIHLEGLRNGERVNADRDLSDADVTTITNTGRVTVNGQEIRVQPQ